MAGIPTVKFDQTPDTYFYLCRNCNTHIALIKFEDLDNHVVHKPTKSINIEAAVNLVNSTPEHYVTGGSSKMAYMCCAGCSSSLGWKYVDVETPTDVIREGRVILFVDRLLFWDGKMIRDGVTTVP